ncbi:MAG TPA: helix-turn-helix transcriptional regulator [Streptosporangiaceae bacterium]|nr:helix-turn-helix transcriptional regulator [Streptosporangiaceae bacterium]
MGRRRRGEADLPPGPARDLADLYRRLRYAKQLSGGQIALKSGLSAGYISEVTRGLKSPRPDTAAKIATALGASVEDVRLAIRLAQELADLNKYNRTGTADGSSAVEMEATRRNARPLDSSEIRCYEVNGLDEPVKRYIAIVTGDIRRVRCVDIWVNSENTEMQMARFNEFSISSIIRYEGAIRDDLRRVVDDRIAAELMRKVAGRLPVPPAAAVVTGSGELWRYGVSHVVHVAAVQGEPGSGFRQIQEVGRCVTNVMTEVDKIDTVPEPRTLLFPLLGAGQGGGGLEATVGALAGAAIDYFSSVSRTRLTTVYFLAYTDAELAVCEKLFNANRRLARVAH